MDTPDQKQNDILIIEEATNPTEGTLVVEEAGASKEGITKHPDGRVTIKLQFPVTYKMKPAPGMGAEREETLAELTFRRPTGGDMTAMQSFREKWDQAKVLFSRCSGINIALIDKMDLADLMVCGEVIDGFLPSGQKTGKLDS